MLFVEMILQLVVVLKSNETLVYTLLVMTSVMALVKVDLQVFVLCVDYVSVSQVA